MNEPSPIELKIVAVPLGEVSSEALVAELQRRGGFRITTDDGRGWVTPGALSRSVGYHGNWLSKILHRGTKPPGLEMERSRDGRLLHVRPSPEFRAWAAARREPAPELPFPPSTGKEARQT